MNQGIISSRYATALLRFSLEQQEEAKVYEEMVALTKSYLEVATLRTMLSNPVVTPTQKQSLLAAAATTNNTLSTSTKRFLELVIGKQREDLIIFIAQSFIDAYRKRLHISEATLTLPTPLSEIALEQLVEKLKKKIKKDFNLTIHYDPSLIGGFIFEYDSTQLDVSVKSKLSHIQRKLQAI